MDRQRITLFVVVAGFLLSGCGGGADGSSGGAPRNGASAEPEVSAESPDAERTMVTGASPEGQRAPPNDSRVPRVVGATLPEAIGELRASGYGCAITGEEDREHPGDRRVLAQDPRPGAKGSEAQLVHLTVSRPPRADALPARCVDQRNEPWATTSG